jgi:hypothetical protein
VPSHGGDD